MGGSVSERTVAFFCVVDGPGYLPKAITALRSVARFHPNAGFYVLGSFGDDADAMAMLAEHGLRFEHLDLSDVFLPTLRLRPRRFARRHPGTSWPSECFWWFDVPAVLADLGYEYSCLLDGDTLCVAPLDLDDVFDGRSPVAGVEIGIGVINSGVLFLDHARALEFGLSDSARKVYETVTTCEHPECTGFCRTRGDQGILVELERRVGLEVRRVGNTYNHNSRGAIRRTSSGTPRRRSASTNHMFCICLTSRGVRPRDAAAPRRSCVTDTRSGGGSPVSSGPTTSSASGTSVASTRSSRGDRCVGSPGGVALRRSDDRAG